MLRFSVAIYNISVKKSSRLMSESNDILNDNIPKNYQCFCSKIYTTYPGIYLHLKAKHTHLFQKYKKLKITKLFKKVNNTDGIQLYRLEKISEKQHQNEINTQKNQKTMKLPKNNDPIVLQEDRAAQNSQNPHQPPYHFGYGGNYPPMNYYPYYYPPNSFSNQQYFNQNNMNNPYQGQQYQNQYQYPHMPPMHFINPNPITKPQTPATNVPAPAPAPFQFPFPYQFSSSVQASISASTPVPASVITPVLELAPSFKGFFLSSFDQSDFMKFQQQKKSQAKIQKTIKSIFEYFIFKHQIQENGSFLRQTIYDLIVFIDKNYQKTKDPRKKTKKYLSYCDQLGTQYINQLIEEYIQLQIHVSQNGNNSTKSKICYLETLQKWLTFEDQLSKPLKNALISIEPPEAELQERKKGETIQLDQSLPEQKQNADLKQEQDQ